MYTKEHETCSSTSWYYNSVIMMEKQTMKWALKHLYLYVHPLLLSHILTKHSKIVQTSQTIQQRTTPVKGMNNLHGWLSCAGLPTQWHTCSQHSETISATVIGDTTWLTKPLATCQTATRDSLTMNPVVWVAREWARQSMAKIHAAMWHAVHRLKQCFRQSCGSTSWS